MNQTCKLCAAPIPEVDLNTQTGLAHCPQCDAVFNFTPAFEADKPHAKTMDAPEGLTSTHDFDGLHLIYRWRKGSLPVQVLAVALVNALVLWWLADAYRQHRLDQAAVGLVFLAVGIWAIGSLLLTLLNRTHIRITVNQLTLRSGPLPVHSQRVMAREQIKQVYVVQFKHGTGRHTHIRYRVQAALYDYADMILVENVGSADDALYIEQQIERFLKIRDVRVAGEFARELF